MGNNIQLLLYLDTSTHFLWMTFSARLMKRRWTGIESYFPLHRVRKWCFRHLWVQSGIPICLLEIGNGGTARRDVVKVCVLSQRPGGCRVHVCFKRDCGLVTGFGHDYGPRYGHSLNASPLWPNKHCRASQTETSADCPLNTYTHRWDGWMDGTIDR